MPDINGFRGLRFDSSKVDLSAVTSPPYDVINDSERAALEEASPYNVVRLILGPLGEQEGKYKQARALLDAWIREGVLLRDQAPGLYIYEERFSVDGETRRQIGILAAARISDAILPHERTMGPIVADRLDVLRETQTNLSPVFCLYWGQGRGIADVLTATMQTAPYAFFTSEDGLGHRAWHLTDPEAIATIAAGLADAKTVIADGHHRYRTAEAYRDERRSVDGPGPWDEMLIYFVDAEHDAPALLPIHRVVSGLSLDEAIERLRPAFEIEPADAHDADSLAAEVQRRRPYGRAFGLYDPVGSWIATLSDENAAAEATQGEHSPAWRDLDVAILHSLVFETFWNGATIRFVHHPHEVAEAVASGEVGEAGFGVMLAATPVSAVRDVAEAADSMPPKSTFFIPKPRTGLVLRPLD